ncbi:response regulator [Brevibacillus ginsengisoli]|uniref:response regulator n=1 Tax=Brevibacillus ginsengisoli TaxID=363854 RepID=UPI003CF8554F
MFKVIIVEDEKPILDLMKHVIGQNPHYTIAGVFTNPFEALASLPDLQPDVAFLDVEMPKMNGLELAQKINEMLEQTKIIFTTAYKQYALDAFQVYAFDYILKPVTPAAIEKVTNRLLKQHLPALPIQESRQQAVIQCFGGFEVRNPKGERVHWRTRKTEELFAYLLCHQGRDVSKWQLMDLLWPDMSMERLSHNLHSTMYHLKKTLKEHEINVDIQKTNDGYMLEPLEFVYDLLEFQRYNSLFSEEVVTDVAQAELLCSLYKGSLMEGKDYLWVAPMEAKYNYQYTSLVRNLVQHDLASEEWRKAERRLAEYLSLYPLHEEMNLFLLQIYASTGKTENIVKHYAQFEASYRREMEIDPPLEMRKWVAPYLA